MTHESVELLSQYLQIDTTNPPGNESEGVEFLAVADEETGGARGAHYLVSNYPDEFQADLVINEGGFGLTSSNAFAACDGGFDGFVG